MYIGNYGGFAGTTCNSPAIARLPNCGGFEAVAGQDWRASAAATSYTDALLAAHAKNRSKYDASLSKGDAYKNQMSGGIVTWLNNARAHVVTSADKAFGRSDTDAARFAQGQQDAASMFIRYNKYSDQAPDISRLVETAADQSLTDIISGDPFRAAKSQKWGPDIFYGDNGFNFLAIGLTLGGIVAAIIAVYAFAGGIGKGLVT